jgi:hypothetical protein
MAQTITLIGGWYDHGHRCMTVDVRFGSLADICSAKRDVRFTPKSGHSWPDYFMAGALPLPGIVICISAGIAALPSLLKVGWRCDDAITSAP